MCAEAPRRALFATGGCDGTTRLWTSSRPGELATLRGHGGPIEAPALPTNGPGHDIWLALNGGKFYWAGGAGVGKYAVQFSCP